MNFFASFELLTFAYELNNYYTNMCPSSLWVSLDFEWIWTFLPSEIINLLMNGD
jgi:hypothetical protein